MKALGAANLGVRFILELCALVALGYWGWHALDGVGGIALAVVAPMIGATVWGLFVAPKAKSRLEDPQRLAVEAGVFLAAFVALMASDLVGLGIAFMAVVVMSDMLMFALGQRGK